MERIQIRFQESDYKIYHDYCLKYYRVHDTARRQSIHAFLDLYEKGILPVEEEDIRPARRFLTEKCDSLNEEQSRTSGGAAPAVHLHVCLCSDLLLFLDDLEKVYRLLKKQGIVPNYLMLLAMFAKVTEEARNDAATDLYDVDRGKIEALATPLAGMIQKRLGTDRQWRSVLKELAFIAARFNQKYPEPVFDLEIVQLIAPAVVAHFSRDTEPRDILAELPACFEECELEEFESLLNRTPEALKIDQEADIDWDAITGPLEEVAGEVAGQRSRLAQEASAIADPALLISGTGRHPSGNDQTPGKTATVPHQTIATIPGGRSFDIAIGPDGSTQVESPMKTYPVPDAPEAKDARQPLVPIVIGIAIIILFIAGTMFLSGSGNLAGTGNASNKTNVSQKNVTPAKTTIKPAATTAKPAATTAKPTATPTATPKVYSSNDIGYHLLDIAFSPDTNAISKPDKSLISISVSGAYNDKDIENLEAFIDDFNVYSATTKMSTNLNYEGKGDIPVVFLSQDGLHQINTDTRTSEYRNTDTGTFYIVTTDQKTYINSEISGAARKKWLLRGVLINMGLIGETTKYPDSIFYTNNNNTVEPTTLDWRAIQLMFGKKVTNDMTKAQLKTLIIT